MGACVCVCVYEKQFYKGITVVFIFLIWVSALSDLGISYWQILIAVSQESFA